MIIFYIIGYNALIYKGGKMRTETLEIIQLIEQIQQNISYNNEEAIKKLSEQLNTVISENFEKSNEEVFTEILNISKTKQDNFSEILSEELDFEIENVLYEDSNGNDIDSTMFLMPCLLTSQLDRFNVPSIAQFETVLKSELVSKGIIKNKDQFTIGTIRLAESDIETMSKQDWWNIHRDIIDEKHADADTRKENEQIRNTVVSYDPASSVSIFYLVATIENKDNNSTICDDLYELESDIDFWGDLMKKHEPSGVKITTLPLMPISEGIENAQFILEGVTFELFFEHGMQESSAIAYSQVKENPDKYVVFFFDDETKYLNAFYYVNIYQDSQNFICHLVELCLNQEEAPLYALNDKISQQQLDTWKDTKQMVDFEKYINNSNKIDLLESIKFCSFSDTISNNNNLLH